MRTRTLRAALAVALGLCANHNSPEALAQSVPSSPWIRVEALPAEMKLTSRETFDGVPTRFVVLTDGSVFLGGRREIIRGFLDKSEMQALSTRLDLALKALGKTPLPPTIMLGDGPATLRFSVLLGVPLHTVIMGDLEASTSTAPRGPRPATSQIVEFIRYLANFRHPSLKPWDPEQFAMIVKEQTLLGGCRSSKGLPVLNTASETVVPAAVTHGFPTGADLTQVCDGQKRYALAFRPLIPGER
jgi:hypothetical protein